MKCISVTNFCLGSGINHETAVKSLGESNSSPASWQRALVSPQILATNHLLRSCLYFLHNPPDQNGRLHFQDEKICESELSIKARGNF